MSDNTKALTVHDATYNLLRKLGLTTIFGNPVRQSSRFLRTSRRTSNMYSVCRRRPPWLWPTALLKLLESQRC
jgi:hypothetical protein